MKHSIKKIKKLCKKPYWHILQEIDHKIAMYLTWIFAHTPITSNQVTVLWILIQCIGSIFLITGQYRYMVIGIIIYHFGSLLDSVDGQLARFRKSSTLKGLYLERMGHHITIPILFVFLSIGVYKMHNNPIYLAFGGLVLVSFFYNKLITLNVPDELKDEKEKLHAKNKRGLMAFTIGFLKVDFILSLLFWLIVFNRAHYALIIYSVFFLFDALKRLTTIIIKLGKIDKKRIIKLKN